jgi:hypothetical protein
MENEIPPYERSIGIQTNQQVSGSSSCQLAGRLRRLFENAHDGNRASRSSEPGLDDLAGSGHLADAGFGGPVVWPMKASVASTSAAAATSCCRDSKTSKRIQRVASAAWQGNRRRERRTKGRSLATTPGHRDSE